MVNTPLDHPRRDSQLSPSGVHLVHKVSLPRLLCHWLLLGAMSKRTSARERGQGDQ